MKKKLEEVCIPGFVAVNFGGNRNIFDKCRSGDCGFRRRDGGYCPGVGRDTAIVVLEKEGAFRSRDQGRTSPCGIERMLK